MSQAVVTEFYDRTAKPKKVWHSWITRFSSITIPEGIKAHPFLFSTQPCWFQGLQHPPPSNTLNKRIFLCSHSKICEILPSPVYTINTLVESKRAATEQTGSICYANILHGARPHIEIRTLATSA